MSFLSNRVDAVKAALSGYYIETEGLSTPLVDLLTDAMHLLGSSSDLFDDALATARSHYETEQAEQAKEN